MGTLNEDLTAIKAVEDKLTANKVANFAYTNHAYEHPLTEADGVETYDVNNEQNIPVANASIMKVNQTILTKGWRSQASSITRMLMNHFLGRCSYNLNKINDLMSNLLSTIMSHLGTANGLATLDANGRIPYSQLPESAVELKGYWDADTNTPILADGTGTNGDEYIVSVAGTQDLGSGSQYFNVGDRVLYTGGVWKNITSGFVRSVSGVAPDAQGNVPNIVRNINGIPADSQGNTPDFLYPTFDSSATYNFGDTVVYEGAVYICSVPSCTGSWNSSNFVPINQSILAKSIKINAFSGVGSQTLIVKDRRTITVGIVDIFYDNFMPPSFSIQNNTTDNIRCLIIKSTASEPNTSPVKTSGNIAPGGTYTFSDSTQQLINNTLQALVIAVPASLYPAETLFAPMFRYTFFS